LGTQVSPNLFFGLGDTSCCGGLVDAVLDCLGVGFGVCLFVDEGVCLDVVVVVVVILVHLEVEVFAGGVRCRCFDALVVRVTGPDGFDDNGHNGEDKDEGDDESGVHDFLLRLCGLGCSLAVGLSMAHVPTGCNSCAVFLVKIFAPY